MINNQIFKYIKNSFNLVYLIIFQPYSFQNVIISYQKNKDSLFNR